MICTVDQKDNPINCWEVIFPNATCWNTKFVVALIFFFFKYFEKCIYFFVLKWANLGLVSIAFNSIWILQVPTRIKSEQSTYIYTLIFHEPDFFQIKKSRFFCLIFRKTATYGNPTHTCPHVTDQLELSPPLDEIWALPFGKVSTTPYCLKPSHFDSP